MKGKTLKREVKFEGVGIHSGQSVKIVIEPKREPGIVFVGMPEEVEIEAVLENVVDSRRGTTIGKGGRVIRTIEHLMAAFHGLGVTSARVLVWGEEIPVLDGSAKGFVKGMEEVGFEEAEEVEPFRVQDRARFRWGDSFYEVRPAEKLEVGVKIEFPEPVGEQYALFTVDANTFSKEISFARTFAFWYEVEELLEQGLIKGGSIYNGILVLEDGFSTPLFVENELARHKLLDLVGDLYLVGRPFVGEVFARRPSHRLNHTLLKVLGGLEIGR